MGQYETCHEMPRLAHMHLRTASDGWLVIVDLSLCWDQASWLGRAPGQAQTGRCSAANLTHVSQTTRTPGSASAQCTD